MTSESKTTMNRPLDVRNTAAAAWFPRRHAKSLAVNDFRELKRCWLANGECLIASNGWLANKTILPVSQPLDLRGRAFVNMVEDQDKTEEYRPVWQLDIPLSYKLMRSVSFGGLRYLLLAPIPFLMTPFILRRIGVTGYGTWAVFLAMNALTSLADLGLVGTISKFVADCHARNDFPALSRLLNSGTALFISLSVLIGSLFWCSAPSMARVLFHGDAAVHAEKVVLLRRLAFLIVANIMTQLFASVTIGLQRLDLASLVSTGNALLSALLGAGLLYCGWGLYGLVDGYVASGFITVVVYLFLVKRLLPDVSLNPMGFDRAEARKMFAYGLRLYVTQAAVVVHNQIEKVFLAILVGVTPAGWYDIGSDIAVKVRGSIGIILGPILPAAAALNALADQSRLRELYYRAHKYLAVCGVPTALYVVCVSSRFVELWLGMGMGMVALPLIALVIANFFNLVTGPGFLIFAGTGHMGPGIKSAVFGLILNAFLSLGLIYKFGFSGAVLGTCLSLIAAAVYFLSMFHRRTGYSVGRVLRESYLKPILCSIVVLSVLLAIRSPRLLSWIGLVAMGVTFSLLYGCAILLAHFFDDYDWNKIENFVPVVRVARKAFGTVTQGISHDWS